MSEAAAVLLDRSLRLSEHESALEVGWLLREAGQLYAAWRQGSAAIRKRILDDPALFFKAQRQEKAPLGTRAELIRDLEIHRDSKPRT